MIKGIDYSKQCEYGTSMGKILDTTKEAIRESKMTLREISRGTGTSDAMLCLLLQGKRGITVDRAERILEFLGYTVQFVKNESEAE